MVSDMEPTVKYRLQTAILLIQFVSMFGVSTDGVFYMNKGARKSYAESSIIETSEKVRLVECVSRCQKHETCKHTAFHGGICTLLSATNFTENASNENTSAEEIYSPVDLPKSGMSIW